MPTQRAFIQMLWQKHHGNISKVAEEYEAAELGGLLHRRSNLSGFSGREYALRLIRDGFNPERKWLLEFPHPDLVTVGSNRVDRPRVHGDSGTPAVQTESLEYLDCISAWRNFWRPSRVRFALIAESHVAEAPGDSNARVVLPPELAAPEMPSGFCRLVYCLGYGEPELCTPHVTGNPGTWQYWDLFGSIASVVDGSIPPEMPRRRQSGLIERLRWKVKVLRALRDAGIWLADASVVGIYAPGGVRRLSGVAYRRSLRRDFNDHVWPSISSDRPTHLWIIGRSVGRALNGLPDIDAGCVISQPQDRNHEQFASDRRRLLECIRAFSGCP